MPPGRGSASRYNSGTCPGASIGSGICRRLAIAVDAGEQGNTAAAQRVVGFHILGANLITIASTWTNSPRTVKLFGREIDPVSTVFDKEQTT